MKQFTHPRAIASLLVIFCLLAAPIAVIAKKGEKHYNQGMKYEAAQQWEKAAEQYALALAANPADAEYQLRYRRSVFNASQTLMMQGRALAEKRDFIGAYNAFRQAYAYDPVNELALSEMERMLRLQRDKENGTTNGERGSGTPKMTQTSLRDGGTTPSSIPNKSEAAAPPPVSLPQRAEQLRIVTFTGDLKQFIRKYAELLGLNVVFDSQSFRQPRNIDIDLKDVSAAQALDYVFLQEGLFFQKLGRRTILVADQTRRGQYQQLVIRTFYLANLDPTDAQKYIQSAIPAQAGRPTTIVIPDKATNSLTVRDTPENIRLIGEILASLDKDRAEVVMDVNLYEVSRADLLQIGNQVGSTSTLVNLGSGQGGITNKDTFNIALPTAFGIGIALPPSAIAFLQSKDKTRLIASNQIHAFNGEESTARIGQRVPVQTAQTFPFGTTSTTNQPGGVNQGVGFAGGFPVFNYEQTGLTLKFTPQVFPNLDVQVKMSIESKDVINPGNPTPTFTERSITGTARIQNNRTMMLASVAQDRRAQSRVGFPILGLIPILGRLFTAPRSDNSQTDIVISVTPRVLRAPAVTPDDELMRPSGTLQTPTSGSVQAVLEEAEREDQLAMARINAQQNKAAAQAQAQPQAPVVQPPVSATQAQAQTQPAADEPPAYVPAPRALIGQGAPATSASTDSSAATNISKALPANVKPLPVNVPKMELQAPGEAFNNGTSNNATSGAAVAGPTSVARPTSLPANNSTTSPSTGGRASEGINAQVGDAPPLRALGDVQSPPKSTGNGAGAIEVSAAQMLLMPALQEMRVGERRRIALMLKTDAPLSLAALTFKFDPKALRVSGVSAGNLLAGIQQGTQPLITQAVDASGLLMVSVAPPSGASPLTGAGVLVFIDIEALTVGESSLSFDKNNVHLVASDGRSVLLDLSEVRVVVKQ